MNDKEITAEDLLMEIVKEMPKEAREAMQDYMELRVRLAAESDRGCALTAAAYLDESLATLLRNRLVQDKGNIEALINRGRPLSTFSARIRIAYAVGLISKDCMSDLNTMRDIRNDFAHLHGPVSFSDQSIAHRCRNLRNTAKGHVADDPRALFINAMTLIHAAISRGARQDPIQAHTPDDERAAIASVDDVMQKVAHLPRRKPGDEWWKQ